MFVCLVLASWWESLLYLLKTVLVETLNFFWVRHLLQTQQIKKEYSYEKHLQMIIYIRVSHTKHFIEPVSTHGNSDPHVKEANHI